MALTGNHGIIIPRNAALLRRLYWNDQKTLPEIGAMYGVTHKSVLRVFRELAIPTRRKGQKPIRGCIECGAPVFKIKHAGNGARYGRRCKRHWNEHRAKLTRQEASTPEGAKRRKKLFDRWYEQGPVNPNGEDQWLTKSKHILRSARRALNSHKSRAASQFPSAASKPARTSPT